MRPGRPCRLEPVKGETYPAYYRLKSNEPGPPERQRRGGELQRIAAERSGARSVHPEKFSENFPSRGAALVLPAPRVVTLQVNVNFKLKYDKEFI